MKSMEDRKAIAATVSNGLCHVCGTCVGICPKGALSMDLDEGEGFFAPHLDDLAVVIITINSFYVLAQQHHLGFFIPLHIRTYLQERRSSSVWGFCRPNHSANQYVTVL